MKLSRRDVLGGGAVLVGAGAVVALGDRTAGALAATGLGPADLEGLDVPIVLSVTDTSAGELEILVGEQAITFTDRGLAARLAREARRGAV
jgi:hypothetical protein